MSFDGSVEGKVVEIDHPGDQVVFQATFIPPVPIHIITFHRTERLPLYPCGFAAVPGAPPQDPQTLDFILEVHRR